MTDSTHGVRIESLLEHKSWLQELARALVRDPHAADDVAQDTWLAALRHRPHAELPLRQWLATVARNFARQSKRGTARRTAREEHAARREALPSTADLVERAALQREVVEAVLELAEPYRTTILLRFLEDRPPRDIARDLGVPVETVRTRIQRGLDRLRARLDEQHGGERQVWSLLLVPPCSAPWPEAAEATPAGERTSLLPASALKAILMKTSTQAALVLVPIAAALVAWLALRDPAVPPSDTHAVAAAASASESTAHAPSALEVATTPAGAREVASAKSDDAAAKLAAVAASVAPMLRGKVLDASGAPRAGVDVEVQSDGAQSERRATSDASGRFEMPVPERAGRIVAADASVATVLAGLCGTGPSKIESIVVVARRVPFAGVVVDELGLPLADVQLAIEIGQDLRARFREVLDRSIAESWSARTDERGAFTFAFAPAVEGAVVTAALDGFDTVREPLPMNGDAHARITLARPTSKDGMVRGKVVDGAGGALGGVYVSFGVDTMKTDAQGAFAFRIDDERSFNRRFGFAPAKITAAKKGFQPALYEARREDGQPVWPAHVVLRLVAPSLSIAGRVLGDDGQPLPDAKVWLTDTTTFGAVGGGPAQLEALLAGVEDRSWNFVEADGEGRFEIEGLMAREYTLAALDQGTLLRTELEGVAAGSTAVELRLPTDSLYPRVAGHIRSSAGKPVAGVRVFPMCDTFRARLSGAVISTSHDGLDGVVTDAEGRFELENVPKSLVYLRIEGETVLPLEYGRYVEGDARFADAPVKELPKDKIEKLDIVVDQRCHVQIELADPSMADALSVLDESGRALELSMFTGNGRREDTRLPIVDGRTAAIGVGDRGKMVVLYKGGAEVARRPVELKAGELVTVNP
ncbi:MAG: sigma-70 family RNA polymerase sigma factor [Planctomycetota bacterium]